MHFLLVLCFLLERSSSSSDSNGRAPRAGRSVRQLGLGGVGGRMSVGRAAGLGGVSGVRRPVGQVSQGERAPWSQLHWGWRHPWAGRGPGWWWRRAVLAPGRPPRLRGPAGSGRTCGGASPSPCAGRRSRSSVLRCSRCTSRWPCAHSSSSSGLGGGDGQGGPGLGHSKSPKSPAQLQNGERCPLNKWACTQPGVK